MIRNILILASLAAALCGCVLQSKSPLYGESDARLVLGASVGAARMSNWQDGTWVPDAEQAELKVSGQHYEAQTKGTPIVLSFVPLGGSWFVLQAVDSGKPAVYMLAEVKGKAVEVHPLACGDLKKDAGLSDWIDYTGDDCFIRPGSPSDQLFASLAKSPGEPSSRLELLP